MIFVKSAPVENLEDARSRLQTAIFVEFSTLPPYLYSLYSLKPGTNPQASGLVQSIAMEEMIHMCLACNMLNAIGGNPKLQVPTYPNRVLHLAEDKPIRLLPFSKEAMWQGMLIECPEDGPIDYKVREMAVANTGITSIAQLYGEVKKFLKDLPASEWQKNRNQIGDAQFLTGELFPINNYDEAERAISIIVEEGEGSAAGPLDLSKDYAHYYKFAEIYNDGQLTVTGENSKPSDEYVYVKPLGVDWSGVYNAISDPGLHDFKNDPQPARDAQDACNVAFTRLVQHLQAAVTGQSGMLGVAARDMFDLRMAARHALVEPLADPKWVSGPAFLYDAKFEDGRAA